MKRPAGWLAIFLILLTSLFLAYRILALGSPVFPTAPGATWQLTISGRVLGEGEEVRVLLGLPADAGGRMVVEERISSGSLSASLFQEGPNRVAAWSGPVEAPGQEISYRATLLVRPARFRPEPPPPPAPDPGRFTAGEAAVAGRLAARWKGLSAADLLRAGAAAAKGQWGSPPPETEDLEAWRRIEEKQGSLWALYLLLRAAQIPARPVEGIRLSEGIQSRPLSWLEGWDGKGWQAVLPERGEVEGDRSSLLPLASGAGSASRIAGGELRDLQWILSRQVLSQWSLHFERIRRSDRFLDRWSLFQLPGDFQQTFRVLLLVPIGTLVIGFLRNVIGFPTFGIFMPVLMALAFRSTGLAYGLMIFSGILLVGYGARRQLDRLRLLLVPRMSVLLTLVIVCFTVLALAGNKLGIREFMAVGLLPFVILTMVIERFFVLIEEAGAKEAFRTAGGSAAVSVLSYGIISWEPLQLTFFVYPELLFAVAAVQILLGRYTGYRLSEIFRFRAIGGPP